MHLLLIDGNAMVYRAHYALAKQGLWTEAGLPTWAVYGFLNTLIDVLEAVRPTHCLVAFDGHEPTFRHRAYRGYKAGRPPMPDELSQQFPMVRRLVDVLGIPIYECEGFEADDVMATLAVQALDHGGQSTILTGDQDLFQVIRPGLRILWPKHGTADILFFDQAAVFRKYGVWPHQFVDYKAMIGDASDRLPGVQKVGAKSAAELLQKFGTVAEILRLLDTKQFNHPKAKYIEADRANLVLSQELARIETEVPVLLNPERTKLSRPDDQAMTAFLTRLEFAGMVRNLERLMTLMQGETA